MAMKLWLKNNKLIVDSTGKPILCLNCPCEQPQDIYRATIQLDVYVRAFYRNYLLNIGYLDKINNKIIVKVPMTITWNTTATYVDCIVPPIVTERCYLKAPIEIGTVTSNSMTIYFNVLYYDIIDQHSAGFQVLPTLILRFNGLIRSSDFRFNSGLGLRISGNYRMCSGQDHGGRYLNNGNGALCYGDYQKVLYSLTSSVSRRATQLYEIYGTCGDLTKPEWGLLVRVPDVVEHVGSGPNTLLLVWALGSWFLDYNDDNMFQRFSSLDVTDGSRTYYAWCYSGYRGQDAYALEGNSIYFLWYLDNQWQRLLYDTLENNYLDTATSELVTIDIDREILGEFL